MAPLQNNNHLQLWLLGALAALNLIIGGLLFESVTSRISRMEDQLAEIDKRVISIQIEHKKARDIEIRIQELEKLLELPK
mgnify:CR=1 FL=1